MASIIIALKRSVAKLDAAVEQTINEMDSLRMTANQDENATVDVGDLTEQIKHFERVIQSLDESGDLILLSGYSAGSGGPVFNLVERNSWVELMVEDAKSVLDNATKINDGGYSSLQGWKNVVRNTAKEIAWACSNEIGLEAMTELHIQTSANSEARPYFDADKQKALDFKNEGHSWSEVADNRDLKFKRDSIVNYAKKTGQKIRKGKPGRPSNRPCSSD